MLGEDAMSEQTGHSTAGGEDEKSAVRSLPHFALRAGGIRPPAKPFFKTASAEKAVSEKAALERPSGDRSFIERMGVMAPTASYTPPPQRRTTEIPNLNTVRAAEAETCGKKLNIGKQIKVSGEISGCEHLVVEGEVDAVMHGVTRLEIAPGGKVAGKADVETAVVLGAFDGALTVHGHLDIVAGASVHGEISYRSVSVANGAKLTGTISMLDD